MPEWEVYFFLSKRGENVIKAWLEDESVQAKQIAAFQEKIDALEQGGPEMVSGFISETPVANGIYKMKIKGNKGLKQLRPMCCRGPFGDKEYTVLIGAIEKDRELIPSDAKVRAQNNLITLRADRKRRRRERLTPKPEE